MGRGKVRVLPDELANRIAAGEVVERPASVVKELVENAVDAGASRVSVAVEGAGKRRLAVADDGEGMAREDALLALERHATSKVSAPEDLERIATLGFRGEALPSIASVCRLRLATYDGGGSEGTEIRVEGGRIVSVQGAGLPRGTSVEVADLFYNTPARRKFLKGDATELRNVVETVTQLALTHFDVGFELRSGPRRLLAVPPGQSLEERAGELVGPEVPGGLHWARGQGDGRALTLAFGAPHEGRGHRKGVRLFVNGRPVQDRLLFRAVLDGYRGVLESGRYPVALLWVELPPEEVDVNVHPAKREVRFRDEGRVFRWVAGHVAEALAGAPWAAAGGLGGAPGLSGAGEASAGRGRGDWDPAGARVERVAEVLGRYGGRASGAAPKAARPGPDPRPRSPAGRLEPLAGEPLFHPGTREEEPAPAGPFGALRFLGAFDATYLVFEDPACRELVLLDQHAAHERILFERLLDQAGGVRGAAAQPLLLPVTLECSPAEMAGFEARREELERLGFRVEPFGPAALAVTAVPAGLPSGGAEAAVRDLLGAEELLDPGADPAARLEAAARRAACAGAVKARHALTASEVQALVRRLGGLRHPSHCPHGRPVLIRIPRGEVESRFHRR
ncbi:MAG: DNA mismatch repair endonuclease MutL [Deferrisomatales bacterium]